MRRWSKLQKQLYALFDPSVDIQGHCRVVRMASERGSTNLPRYWITLHDEVIWDYPGQFVGKSGLTRRADGSAEAHYPYMSDVPLISALIREYIDTAPSDLLVRHFENDHWGLVNILRAADARVGRRQWSVLRRKTRNIAALKVLAARESVRLASARRLTLV